MARKEEHILVFPTSLLRQIGYFSGFSADPERYLQVVLDGRQTTFKPRSEVEQDPSFKQLIPYVLLKHDGTVFRYTRGKKGPEERLRRLYSIGIGGHISSDDPNLFAPTYQSALEREVKEEVRIGCAYRSLTVGVINDDSNPVGQVHFGVVHLFELESPSVARSESVITETGFVPIERLRDEWDRYETWSQLCIEYLERQAAGHAR